MPTTEEYIAELYDARELANENIKSILDSLEIIHGMIESLDKRIVRLEETEKWRSRLN